MTCVLDFFFLEFCHDCMHYFFACLGFVSALFELITFIQKYDAELNKFCSSAKVSKLLLIVAVLLQLSTQALECLTAR